MLECIDSASMSFNRDLTNKAVRKIVKTETGLDVRRMDNFCLVSIHVLNQLLKTHNLSGNVGLYSAAKYFSVELLQGLIGAINAREEIRPADFISTVGNTANYYMAKLFELNGPNIFIGSTTEPTSKLKSLAACDLHDQIIDYAVVVVWTDFDNYYQCDAKLVKIR